MKNIFKKMAVVLCISTLLVTPAIASAATPDNVYEDPSRQVKAFTYESMPITVTEGGSCLLENNENNGLWYIREGQSLRFNANFAYPVSSKFLIIRTDNNPAIVASGDFEKCSGIGSGAGNLPEGNYEVVILSPDDVMGITFYIIDID